MYKKDVNTKFQPITGNIIDPNNKYKLSYDILDELVRSTEKADSHPLQHSAKEYREALEVFGKVCRRSPHVTYGANGSILLL